MPYINTLATALSQARTFLNDQNSVVWSDANLIPSLQQAHFELQSDLWLVGSPTVRGVTGPIFVPSGADPNINPALPSDMLIPTVGQECGVTSSSTTTYTDLVISGNAQNVISSAAHPFVIANAGFTIKITGGSGFTPGVYVILFVDGSGNATLSENVGVLSSTGGVGTATYGVPDNKWLPLTEQFFLTLGALLAPTLVFWAWQEEIMSFVGASANRFVSFQYRRLIPIPVAVTDPIGITFGEMYLGARGAAIAAGATGNVEAEAKLDALAKQNFAKVVMANRGQQKPPTKP